MKSILFIKSVFVFCIFSVTAQADIVQKQALSFSDVETLVSDIAHPNKTLLIVGFQDTLATLPCDFSEPLQEKCPYLGSVAWLDWQASLLDDEPDSEYLVAPDKSSLLEVSSLILSEAQFSYPEKITPKVLEDLSQQGVRIMFITQYDRQQRLVEHVALSLVFNQEKRTSLGDLLVNHSPKVVNSHEAVAVCNQSSSTNISYQNGVLYTSGQSKSLVMKCLLELYNAQLKASADNIKQESQTVPSSSIEQASKIIFVDDKYSQVEAFYDAYRGNNDYDIFSLNYLALSDERKGLLTDENEVLLQKQSHKKWLEIKDDILDQIFTDEE